MVELENQTRNVYYLPVRVTRERKGGLPPITLVDHGRTLVIGDCADRTLPPGIERSHLCPSPTVVLTLAEFDNIGPAMRSFIDKAIERGHIRRRDFIQ